MAAGEAFDPMLIVYQMVALQCFYYLAAGVLFGACHVLFGTRISLDLFFSARHLTTASAAGWLEIVIVFLGAFAGCSSLPRRATEPRAGRAPIPPPPCPISDLKSLCVRPWQRGASLPHHREVQEVPRFHRHALLRPPARVHNLRGARAARVQKLGPISFDALVSRRPLKQLPSTWDWWIVHGISLVIMTVLGASASRARVWCVPHRIHRTARGAFCACVFLTAGEYLCSRRELQEIPLTS